jgi:murein DD-endopeptidase MepM/ murein hydrolase activator NlpD
MDTLEVFLIILFSTLCLNYFDSLTKGGQKMNLIRKYNKDKNNSIVLLALLLLFIFSISFHSLANNNEFISYKVTKGDSLWSISQKYNVSLDLILSYNQIKEKDILSLGQIIRIPQDNFQNADYIVHIVKKGETLWSIAQEYNLSVDLILATNNIANSELISIGQEMKIPSHKNAVAETNIVNQVVIDKKNNNINNNISQLENAESIVYTVKAGDNLWNIAQRYGVSVEVIIEVNNLRDKDLLSLGQKLEIPAIGGGGSDSYQEREPTIITHTVVKGDTLWGISKRYDVTMSSIISTNNLKEISRLSIGQELKIPITNMDIAEAEGYKQEAAAEEIIYYVEKGESLWSISRNYNVKLESIIAANNITDASKISAGKRLIIPNVPLARRNSNICNFIWPLRGRITSPYGVRVSSRSKEFHSGIDISSSFGSNIVAAENGRVSYAGYMRGYGNVIILSHDEGYSTVYAHNSVNLVKKGQYVKKGSVIAKVGRTGNATGPHLHFEVRLSGKPLNPLLYLK